MRSPALAPPPPPPAFLSQSGPCLPPFETWQLRQHCCPGCPFQASREHPATLQVAALGNLPPHPLPPPRAPLLPPSSGSALLPPLPPPLVAPLLPAAAAISARACISAQPRMLVPGQREGMEASLWPMSRPVPQLQSFRVISAMTRSPVSSSRACSSGTPSAFCTHTALATSHTSASLSQARTERQNGAGPWPLAAKPPPGSGRTSCNPL